MMSNYFRCEFSAISQNEALARAVVSAFLIQFDPTLEELNDVRTAVCEAVTNSIIHGYKRYSDGASEDCIESAKKEELVEIECMRDGDIATIAVSDKGCGIADIEQARTPLYTSASELERSGLGFTIMESFSDGLEVFSEPDRGTRVVLTKIFHRLNEE